MRQRCRFSVVRMLCIATAGVWLIGGASLLPAQPPDRYIKGYQGPYRGRVLDAETKAPLAGAVVVVVWERVKVQLIQSATVFYAAREVLTDANGEFILHAEDIERKAPRQTLRPRFVVFTPGYASARGVFDPRTKIELMELRRLETLEERRRALLSPFDIGAVGMDESNRKVIWLLPRKKLEHFLRLINVERFALGLGPIEY